MLVVTQPQSVGTDFPDQCKIGIQRFLANGGANTMEVLMLRNTVQAQLLSIQEESLLGSQLYAPKTEGKTHLVEKPFVLPELRGTGIQVWVILTVPQVWFLDLDCHLRCCRQSLSRHAVTIGIRDAIPYLCICFAQNMGIQVNRSVGSGVHFQTASSEIGGVEAGLLRFQQDERTVNATPVGKVAHQRIHIGITGVVRQNGQQILATANRIGGIQAKPAVATPVLPQKQTVQEYPCHTSNSLKTEKIPFFTTLGKRKKWNYIEWEQNLRLFIQKFLKQFSSGNYFKRDV